MLSAFLVSVVAVVLAEMGDKTQLLAIAFAGKFNWRTVMWAVFWATLFNHLAAVALGTFATAFLPMEWIKLIAAFSFIALGVWTIHSDKLGNEAESTWRTPFWTVAIAFFIAEIGDKTQIMTIALAADQTLKAGSPDLIAKITQGGAVLMGTTTGMLIADAIGIIAGVIMRKHIPERGVHWFAALCFVGFGFLGLHDALDHLLPKEANTHHIVLLACIPLVVIAMWLVGRAEKPEDDAVGAARDDGKSQGS